MDLGLTRRVAIVAAASKGLGRAVAEELAREGAHVAICARTPDTLAQTATDIQKCSGREIFHQALDVTDSSAVGAFVSDVEARFGRIDICVTNSGGPPSNSFKNTRPEDWRTAVDQLLMSTIFFARETLPRMQKNKWGRMITITSSAVKQPVDGLLLFNSARAAVTGLARTLANEYAADGITVNNVCPRYTRTARLDGSLLPSLRAPVPSPRKSLPLGNAKFRHDVSVRPRNSRPSWLSLLPNAPAISPAPPSLLMGALSGLSSSPQ
jgi:3-oxoacyl-[acyl-carrier protein] reductase